MFKTKYSPYNQDILIIHTFYKHFELEIDTHKHDQYKVYKLFDLKWDKKHIKKKLLSSKHLSLGRS